MSVTLLVLFLGFVWLPRAVEVWFPPERTAPLRVGVASSLAGAVREVLATGGGEAAVEVVAASSGRLVNQTAAGGRFDVLVLADPERMDRLAAEGTIFPQTRRDLAGNRLVVARLRDRNPSPSPRSAPQRVALAEPKTVPLGRYTRQAIASGGVVTPLPDEVVYAASAAQVGLYLASGQIDLAVMYASDAGPWTLFEAVEQIDASLHDPIRYPAAVTRDARDLQAAVDLLDRLSSAAARRVFEADGFVAPPGAE